MRCDGFGVRLWSFVEGPGAFVLQRASLFLDRLLVLTFEEHVDLELQGKMMLLQLYVV